MLTDPDLFWPEGMLRFRMTSHAQPIPTGVEVEVANETYVNPRAIEAIGIDYVAHVEHKAAREIFDLCWKRSYWPVAPVTCEWARYGARGEWEPVERESLTKSR